MCGVHKGYTIRPLAHIIVIRMILSIAALSARGEERMEAVVQSGYGPPDVLQVQEVAKPTPADDELLIRVTASVVSPVDCAFRAGDPAINRLFTGLRKPKHPIPGSMIAGEIEAAGSEVTQFQAGDRVFGSAGTGAHAEYVCLSEDAQLVRTPPSLTAKDAVAIADGGLTALPFLREKVTVRPGQQVLVNGASGAVGTAAVQLAKYFGATVTGVCSTPHVDLVQSLGADKVIDYTKTDFSTTSNTYDVIFDAVGKRSFSECKPALTDDGVYLTTVSSVGVVMQMAWTSVVGGKRAVFTTTGLRSSAARTEDLRFLRELAEAEKLRTVVDRHYPLVEITDAHRYVEQGHKTGSVVVDVRDR